MIPLASISHPNVTERKKKKLGKNKKAMSSQDLSIDPSPPTIVSE